MSMVIKNKPLSLADSGMYIKKKCLIGSGYYLGF